MMEQKSCDVFLFFHLVDHVLPWNWNWSSSGEKNFGIWLTRQRIDWRKRSQRYAPQIFFKNFLRLPTKEWRKSEARVPALMLNSLGTACGSNYEARGQRGMVTGEFTRCQKIREKGEMAECKESEKITIPETLHCPLSRPLSNFSGTGAANRLESFRNSLASVQGRTYVRNPQITRAPRGWDFLTPISAVYRIPCSK